MTSGRFWQQARELLASRELVIDRPKGSRHPRYPECVYPLDYGYLAGTRSNDGGGIDVWLGSQPDRRLTGVLCCCDTLKGDMEVKLVVGRTDREVEAVMVFSNTGYLSAVLLPAPASQK